jgi:hypothetical protein
LGQASASPRASAPDPAAHQTSSGVSPVDSAAAAMASGAPGTSAPNGIS